MAAQKNLLRTRLTNNMISTRTSKVDISQNQEKKLRNAVSRVCDALWEKYPDLKLIHVNQILLEEIISSLKEQYKDMEFSDVFSTSSIRPDGGLLFMIDKNKKSFPILISEKKNQGTNDLRLQEGKSKQAKGNAIERLGKNVIGLKTYTAQWGIFPFICFGDGCDFADDSSIIDRVKTIAMFGKLNQIAILPDKAGFVRGAYFFRQKEWSEDEMFEYSLKVAEQSIEYYVKKYGKTNFF